MGAHVSKTYTSRTQRGLKPFSSVSKEIKKANRKDKDLFKSIAASSLYKRENLKDHKLVKKWLIEKAMTNLAYNTFKTYHGKIQWSKIVQSIKTDKPLSEATPANEKNVVIDYSKVGEVRIRTSEVEKYSKYLADR